MSLNIGDHVVYCSKEICLIESVVKKCFDGKNEIDYFRLVPVNTNKSSYYIPCENCESKVRPLLTKDEIYKLIDDIPSADEKWYDDRSERKHIFRSVLKSDDYHEIISMMHSLHIHEQEQISKGKKLLASDERIMNEAKHLIDQEFAFVLGINEDDVKEFIKTKLSHKS